MDNYGSTARKTAFKARCLLVRVNPRLCCFVANLSACMDVKSVLWYTIGVRIYMVKKNANIILVLRLWPLDKYFLCWLIRDRASGLEIE